MIGCHNVAVIVSFLYASKQFSTLKYLLQDLTKIIGVHFTWKYDFSLSA